ncbi:HAMP domain-containing histidine kinase [Modestobacter muralis]|uniref:histidine kinase n=1 Tax=Modestobacter muralis TaxID=1608614 RepID=A0A6P0EQV0_9ACTN|nr:HAMP domain-containing histidine kinase [Modestobacter muralis]NEN49576.1 HAMP domain-containing histidine kinase [Modestobacter muralis]
MTSAVDGDQVVIRISDSGTGIPDHVRGKIFDPFFTTKDVGRGTGQGLPLARAVVREAHGGSLTVRSEPGAGSTFTVRLPIDGAPVPAGA